MGYLRRVWSFDFQDANLDNRRGLRVFGLVVATLAMGVLLPIAGSFDAAADLLLTCAQGNAPQLSAVLNVSVAYVLLAGMLILVVSSVGYAVWSALYGPRRTEQAPVFWACALAALVEIVSTNLLVLGVGAFANAVSPANAGVYQRGFDVLTSPLALVTKAFDRLLPTLAPVPPAWAIVPFYLVSGLSFYLMHRLFHTSRVLWLLAHRPHHVPANLVGINPPVAVFGVIFTVLPRALVSGVFAKLFPYKEAQTAVFLILFVSNGLADLAAHQSVLYDVVMRNRILKAFNKFLGGGPLHYVHHSSRPEHEMANLDGFGFFLMWDRLFGTYHEPPAERPVIGLTNAPVIRLSPFLILFSGYQQLAYELFHNKSWRTRFRILFGSVRYKPPITREFLIVSTPTAKPAAALASTDIAA